MTDRELAIGIIRRLRRHGHEALLAGGCVRDRLLRRRPKDYDVATSARPVEIQKLFGKTLSIGAQFGVIVVLDGAARVEVATFRSDEAYRDGRHPSGVRFTTAAEDARRRDFTINALFYDPIRRETIDYVGGRRDLERRLVRAVGKAEARFGEDHLRMLRAVRFASRLGFRLGGATRRAIRELAPLVKRVSAERIRDELATILIEPTRAEGVRLTDRLGLLEQILPEVVALKGCRQGRRHHPEGDVWRHTLLCLAQLRRPTFPLALATLLHDIGKPATADYAGGEVHFYRHQQVGAEMAAGVARRLKLAGAEAGEVRWLIHRHLDFMHARKMRRSTLRRLFQSPHFQSLAELHRADLLGSCASLADHRYVMRRYRGLSEEEIRPLPLVTGHDLMALGMEAGPALGRLLRRLYDEQLDGHLANRRQARARARRLISEESSK